MHAWERELASIRAAVPPRDNRESERNWMQYLENGRASDEKLFRDWESVVPGSLAPCHLINAAVQCMENRGYDVSAAEELLDEGLEAARARDGRRVQTITAEIYRRLNDAPKNPMSPYWTYTHYSGWEDVSRDAVFQSYHSVDVGSSGFRDRIRAGWLAQLAGGALGTQIEGYTTANIKTVFGNVTGYLRPPETYNDDITYEIAFLDAFGKKGYSIASRDIAFAWLDLISDGYSAEEVALNNLRRGVMPPRSGVSCNYYFDWIGAQMRTAVHGMAAPGNPRLAARLAIDDSVISHSNNGMLGGMFNAVLVSLAFVKTDVRELVEEALASIPENSEYRAVGSAAVDTCRAHDNWESAWPILEKSLERYHWIHAYPNLAAEILALWFGQGDFDRTANIIAMAGRDVDCNAAPVLNVLAIMRESVSEEWTAPLGDRIKTFLRARQTIMIDDLANETVMAVRNAMERGEEATEVS